MGNPASKPFLIPRRTPTSVEVRFCVEDEKAPAVGAGEMVLATLAETLAPLEVHVEALQPEEGVLGPEEALTLALLGLTALVPAISSTALSFREKVAAVRVVQVLRPNRQVGGEFWFESWSYCVTLRLPVAKMETILERLRSNVRDQPTHAFVATGLGEFLASTSLLPDSEVLLGPAGGAGGGRRKGLLGRLGGVLGAAAGAGAGAGAGAASPTLGTPPSPSSVMRSLGKLRPLLGVAQSVLGDPERSIDLAKADEVIQRLSAILPPEPSGSAR